MIVVAVASGTSADGLDVGVYDVAWQPPGEIWMRVLGARTEPWPGDLASALLGLLPPAVTTAAELCELDTAVGQTVGRAARRAIEEICDGRADLVVSPGQTVFHDVRDGRCHGTLQLGQPAWVTEATGLPVVSDLRARDVAAGGHGAPLASTFDALWLAGERAVAALNLGGIANVTVVRGDGPPRAWDTGPANCLLDVAAARVTGGRQRFDRDGAIAAGGQVRGDLLDVLLRHPHFALPPPASTGREAFSAQFLDSALASVPALNDGDLLATLTELTAVSVARALQEWDVAEVVASGGGTRNPTLMAALRRALSPSRLTTSDDRGLPVQAKETALWALLGFLTWHGLPGTTGATGAETARVLGRITPGDSPLVLPSPVEQPPTRLVVCGAIDVL